MSEFKKVIGIPDAAIMNRILIIRDSKVMIDSDLAELYGVTTKRLNEQVKRNHKRFPKDFMFQLSETEKEEVVAICDHLKKLKFSPYLPYVFTEHGTVMLAGILNSDRAIEVNIMIVRTFNKMREMLSLNNDVLLEIEKIKKQLSKQGDKIIMLIDYLKQFDDLKQDELQYKNRPRIGYKTTSSSPSN